MPSPLHPSRNDPRPRWLFPVMRNHKGAVLPYYVVEQAKSASGGSSAGDTPSSGAPWPVDPNDPDAWVWDDISEEEWEAMTGGASAGGSAVAGEMRLVKGHYPRRTIWIDADNGNDLTGDGSRQNPYKTLWIVFLSDAIESVCWWLGRDYIRVKVKGDLVVPHVVEVTNYDENTGVSIRYYDGRLRIRDGEYYYSQDPRNYWGHLLIEPWSNADDASFGLVAQVDVTASVPALGRRPLRFPEEYLSFEYRHPELFYEVFGALMQNYKGIYFRNCRARIEVRGGIDKSGITFDAHGNNAPRYCKGDIALACFRSMSNCVFDRCSASIDISVDIDPDVEDDIYDPPIDPPGEPVKPPDKDDKPGPPGTGGDNNPSGWPVPGKSGGMPGSNPPEDDWNKWHFGGEGGGEDGEVPPTGSAGWHHVATFRYGVSVACYQAVSRCVWVEGSAVAEVGLTCSNPGTVAVAAVDGAGEGFFRDFAAAANATVSSYGITRVTRCHHEDGTATTEYLSLEQGGADALAYGIADSPQSTFDEVQVSVAASATATAPRDMNKEGYALALAQAYGLAHSPYSLVDNSYVEATANANATGDNHNYGRRWCTVYDCDDSAVDAAENGGCGSDIDGYCGGFQCGSQGGQDE